ncbi:hypothetical protein GDO81_012379 [Engystomops pustulosus]|uniref:Uncharacterized protein n=1 Tax=Engystomops pustulosus TaxID=76066 RepID=A0AAV7BLW0_ENGPU|nr:hypothetical protein GDO81_012379 [Engystomops pustulosus]
MAGHICQVVKSHHPLSYILLYRPATRHIGNEKRQLRHWGSFFLSLFVLVCCSFFVVCRFSVWFFVNLSISLFTCVKWDFFQIYF